MPQINQMNIRNLLLRALPRDVFASLQEHMIETELPIKHYLSHSNLPISHVCFPECGLASVVAKSADHKSAEVRHVGREGFTGYQVLMGVDRAETETFMQMAGEGFLVPVAPFVEIARGDSVADFFLRYIHTCETQAVYTALSNAQYIMHERLARWLLMCHDRVDGNNLPLTHEFLALMLGVRRSGVTEHLHVLEGIHAIKSTRANILVKDRALLEQIARGSYGPPELEYERLFGFPVRKLH